MEMTEVNPTTTMNRANLIEMFLDGTAGEVYAQGRLVTQDEGEGVVSLIAYGWNKIAEYDETEQSVTISPVTPVT
jgi:hypothetical protein